jgi:hypothetical protein
MNARAGLVVFPWCGVAASGARCVAASGARRVPPDFARAAGDGRTTARKSTVPQPFPPHPILQAPVASTELKGFILTRHWRDAPSGTEIEYWLATDTGPVKVVLTAQTSVAFVAARHRAAVEAQLATMPGMELRELDLKTFQQEPVLGIYAKQFRQLGRLARALQPQGIP